MIDLHTHSLLSDGELLPSELVRRAKVIGYRAIAITDHADASNVDFVAARLAKVCPKLSAAWNIHVIAGIELTHVPLENFRELVALARKNGAMLVVAHGETIAEPVIPGTNRKAIECDIDILAHPGLITPQDAKLAAKRGICLEITSRKGHSLTNGHVAKVAMECGAKLVLNTDAHAPKDLLRQEDALRVVMGAGIPLAYARLLFKNSEALVAKKIKKIS